jgi:hypothetical protein
MFEIDQINFSFYILLFVACFFEGEISVIAATISVQAKAANLFPLVIITIASTISSD